MTIEELVYLKSKCESGIRLDSNLVPGIRILAMSNSVVKSILSIGVLYLSGYADKKIELLLREKIKKNELSGDALYYLSEFAFEAFGKDADLFSIEYMSKILEKECNPLAEVNFSSVIRRLALEGNEQAARICAKLNKSHINPMVRANLSFSF
jgi:hypothetical protein